MKRTPTQRLDDILEAIADIRVFLGRGPLSDKMVLSAVRDRLITIGEAVKSLPADLTAAEPSIPWREIAGMRDWLAHGYFSVSVTVVQATVDNDLDPLGQAIRRMKAATP